MAGGVLEFDVGNTALKWRLCHQHGFERGRLPCDEGRVAALLEGLRPGVIHISSVASDDANAMLRRCARHFSCSRQLTSPRLPCPPTSPLN